MAKWLGVSVSVESAKAGAKTITAVTKANPAVASSTTHGYSDGDYVLISAQGMSEIDGIIVRVAGKTTDTFQLEGINSTDYDTFTSGTAEKLTFGTSLTSATNVNASGGEVDLVDESTIHDLVRSASPGLASFQTFNFECKWDPADAGLVALNAEWRSQSELGVHIAWPDGKRYLCRGYVAAPMNPTGAFNEVVKTPVTITQTGYGTAYST